MRPANCLGAYTDVGSQKPDRVIWLRSQHQSGATGARLGSSLGGHELTSARKSRTRANGREVVKVEHGECGAAVGAIICPDNGYDNLLPCGRRQESTCGYRACLSIELVHCIHVSKTRACGGRRIHRRQCDWIDLQYGNLFREAQEVHHVRLEQSPEWVQMNIATLGPRPSYPCRFPVRRMGHSW